MAFRFTAAHLPSRPMLIGGALVAALTLFAVITPLIASHDPLTSDFVHGISESGAPVGPSGNFLLGTDRIFRDQLVRLAVAARISLAIAMAATAIALSIGSAIGIVAGFFAGSVVDNVLMRIVDVGLAFPFLILVMAIGAALERTDAMTIMATLGLTGWLGTARLMRAKTLQVRTEEFIVAARASGQSTTGILAKHIVPNVSGAIVINATTSVAQMILAESSLSYLGVGIAPPTPTLGRMLFDGVDLWATAPWLTVAPAVAILMVVGGFNFIGEGFQADGRG